MYLLVKSIKLRSIPTFRVHVAFNGVIYMQGIFSFSQNFSYPVTPKRCCRPAISDNLLYPTCPLLYIPIVGVGKERRIKSPSMVKPGKAAPAVTGTTLRTAGPLPTNSRK